jgi:hypothetical protein
MAASSSSVHAVLAAAGPAPALAGFDVFFATYAYMAIPQVRAVMLLRSA